MSGAQWIADIARAVVRELIGTRTTMRGRVVTQHDDDTIDVALDDTKQPSLTSVPIRTLPGVVPRVLPGTLVDVVFEHGRDTDAPQPVATLFEARGLDSIKVTAAQSITLEAPTVKLGAGAARAVALDGDIGIVNGIGPTGPFTGTFQIIASSAKAKGS